ALREIRQLQGTTKLAIPRAPFVRLVSEITDKERQKYYRSDAATPKTRWERATIEGLRETAEAFVIARFEDANLVAVHANRRTLMQKDMQLINLL
ncbi:histone H3 variant, partial [Geranomyces variabilis]